MIDLMNRHRDLVGDGALTLTVADPSDVRSPVELPRTCWPRVVLQVQCLARRGRSGAIVGLLRQRWRLGWRSPVDAGSGRGLANRATACHGDARRRTDRVGVLGRSPAGHADAIVAGCRAGSRTSVRARARRARAAGAGGAGGLVSVDELFERRKVRDLARRHVLTTTASVSTSGCGRQRAVRRWTDRQTGHVPHACSAWTRKRTPGCRPSLDAAGVAAERAQPVDRGPYVGPAARPTRSSPLATGPRPR